MKRAAPKFKTDELPEAEREFLAWVHAVDERGEPRYGVTTMPALGMLPMWTHFYDIIRVSRMAYVFAKLTDEVGEIARRRTEDELSEMAKPVETAERLQRALDAIMARGAKAITVQKSSKWYTINNVFHGATLLQAMEKCASGDKSSPV